MKKILLLFFLFHINNSIYSQENIEKSQTDKIIKTAENYIIKENYSSADSLLKNIILNSKLVPSEITFLFGKNSFFINKYKQSINWLNKLACVSFSSIS